MKDLCLDRNECDHMLAMRCPMSITIMSSIRTRITSPIVKDFSSIFFVDKECLIKNIGRYLLPKAMLFLWIKNFWTRKQSRRRQHWQNIVVHLASKVLASLLLPYYCMTELQSISSAKNFVPKCIPNNFWESAPAVYLLNNNIWPYYILFMFCVSYEWAFFVY